MCYIGGLGDLKLAAAYANSDAVPHMFIPMKKPDVRLAVLPKHLGFDYKRIQFMCLEKPCGLAQEIFCSPYYQPTGLDTGLLGKSMHTWEIATCPTTDIQPIHPRKLTD